MIRRILASLTAAAVITGIIATGILYRADNTVCDLIYQKTGAHDRDILVIGIDQDTLDALGPATTLRGAMAKVIGILNSSSEDAPAVIGIDIMYTGENSDAPEADIALAEAAGLYPNVVVGADIRFGNELYKTGDGVFMIRQDSVTGYYEPYPALKEQVSYGHLNEMLDKDGIFRHALLYVDVPGKGRVDSFASVVFDKWCESQNAASGFKPAVSEDGFYYLPFSQKSGEYCDGISFLDLYNGSVSPYFYRDKIVLIGPYAPGMQDEYYTSLNHSLRMTGVDIQANIIEAFQKGFFPVEVSHLLQLGILFAVCVLLGLFFYNRKVLPSAIGWIAACCAWIGICMLAYFKMSLILHALWIPVGVSVLFIGSIASNLIRSRKEKLQVQDTFGHYIDPQIMEQLLARGSDALELGGKTVNIAVLFVDVRGFTAMSEELDAQTVVEIVNRYLTLTTECIMANHGTLDKFVGDCTMAIWNAPLEQKDPVYLACRAAMDMIERSESLGIELEERYGRSVSFGIGVNWGPAVVGNIGAPKRMDYTAVGDTVNTAARLEANAPGGTILISRAVADELKDIAEVTSLGDSISLKGKSAGFEVLRLDKLL